MSKMSELARTPPDPLVTTPEHLAIVENAAEYHHLHELMWFGEDVLRRSEAEPRAFVNGIIANTTPAPPFVDGMKMAIGTRSIITPLSLSASTLETHTAELHGFARARERFGETVAKLGFSMLEHDINMARCAERFLDDFPEYSSYNGSAFMAGAGYGDLLYEAEHAAHEGRESYSARLFHEAVNRQLG